MTESRAPLRKGLIAELRKQRDAERERAPRPDEDWRYHEAAAVLAWFEINPTLQPVGRDAGAESAALERLVRDSISWTHGAGARRWTLKNDVRKQVLERLGTRERIARCLDANPNSPSDALQRVFERVIRSDRTAVDQDTPTSELEAVLQVLDWLPSAVRLECGLPAESEIQGLIARRGLSAQFMSLVTNFRGRRRELDVLTEYVEVLGPTSAFSRVRRAVRQIRSLKEKPPLMIYGPGGMGKSTLLARFILDHTSADGPSLPFVYLDCDRPGLVPEEPLTLLVEAVHQLGIQFPVASTLATQLEDFLRRELASASASQATITGAAIARQRASYLDAFRGFVADLNIGELPLLFVLDTFETVQYRGHAYIQQLWQFLEELQGLLPRLRTVVSGRARVRDLPIEALALETLDAEAAQGLLQALGISHPDTARVIAKQMRYNPLSLKLAAQVLRFEGAAKDGIADITTERLFKSVDDSLVQGQLYRRILSHVSHPDVRKLAHPGLILRRVTPELIQLVLAKPCGVEVKDIAAAEELFELLKREVSLVNASASNDAEVRHRPDVRRVMIELLRKAEPEKTESIQRAAVSYYEQRSAIDPELRAEELYHRLALGQDRAAISKRWMAGVEDSLRPAMEELPEQSRRTLGSFLDIEVDVVDTSHLPLEEWQAIAKRRADALLRVNRPDEALAALRERDNPSRPADIDAMEADILERLGRLREARTTALSAIRKSPDEWGSRVLACFLIVARADEVLGQPVGRDFDVADTYHRLVPHNADDVKLIELGLSWRASLVSIGESVDSLDELIQVATSGMGPISQSEHRELFNRLMASGAVSIPPRAVTPRPTEYPGTPTPSVTSGVLSPADLARFADFLVPIVQRQTLLNVLVGRAFRISAAEFLGPNSPTNVARFLVEYAVKMGQVADLVQASMELLPESDEPRRLWAAMRMDTAGVGRDPIAALLIGDGEPFVGRALLRDFMRGIVGNNPDAARILIVAGSATAEKAMTPRYVNYVCSATAGLSSAIVDLAREGSVDELVVTIRRSLGFDSALSRSRETIDTPRYLVGQLMAEASKGARPAVIVFDLSSSKRLPYEVRDFLNALAHDIDRATRSFLRLVVLSDGDSPFEVSLQRVRREYPEPPSNSELLAYFNELLPFIGLSDDHRRGLAPALVDTVSRRRAAGDSDALRVVVKGLIEKSRDRA